MDASATMTPRVASIAHLHVHHQVSLMHIAVITARARMNKQGLLLS